MKYVDEFRDPEAAKALLARIERDAKKLDRPIALMEVCGGHTHTIYRYGLENLLPENVELIHGPGCPVCVIPMGRVDDAIWLAQQEGVIFTTFGDMMRVPGSETSLMQARARARRAVCLLASRRPEDRYRKPRQAGCFLCRWL